MENSSYALICNSAGGTDNINLPNEMLALVLVRKGNDFFFRAIGGSVPFDNEDRKIKGTASDTFDTILDTMLSQMPGWKRYG